MSTKKLLAGMVWTQLPSLRFGAVGANQTVYEPSVLVFTFGFEAVNPTRDLAGFENRAGLPVIEHEGPEVLGRDRAGRGH